MEQFLVLRSPLPGKRGLAHGIVGVGWHQVRALLTHRLELQLDALGGLGSFACLGRVLRRFAFRDWLGERLRRLLGLLAIGRFEIGRPEGEARKGQVLHLVRHFLPAHVSLGASISCLRLDQSRDRPLSAPSCLALFLRFVGHHAVALDAVSTTVSRLHNRWKSASGRVAVYRNLTAVFHPR